MNDTQKQVADALRQAIQRSYEIARIIVKANKKMNDTVQKLMGLVSEYAYNCSEDTKYGTFSAETTAARQALEAELTRLFTPLSDEQIAVLQFEHLGKTMWFTEIVRAIEQHRGIGEAK